jgi:hypothetical protein
MHDGSKFNFQASTIKRLCREMNLKPTGSAVDMMMSIWAKSVCRGKFNGAYEKIYGQSGNRA